MKEQDLLDYLLDYYLQQNPVTPADCAAIKRFVDAAKVDMNDNPPVSVSYAEGLSIQMACGTRVWLTHNAMTPQVSTVVPVTTPQSPRMPSSGAMVVDNQTVSVTGEGSSKPDA